MLIKTGIDIQNIQDFTQSVFSGGDIILSKIFLPEELTNRNPEHLVGVFCAKEAILKALPFKSRDWLKIYIKYQETGKPYAVIDADLSISSSDLSISHNKDYAVAVYCALLA